MRRHSGAALACAVLLAVSAVASAASPPGPVGIPRAAADPNVKTVPLTKALVGQADLSSFAAILKFIGADDEVGAATDADLVTFAPTNAALDAFAREMTGKAKATAKDLLQEQYIPLLAHIVSSHIGDDDADKGVYHTLGGQTLVVTDADGGVAKAASRVAVAPSASKAPAASANIVRHQDLGDAGDIYVVDRVVKPADVYATPAEAFKADPELGGYGRLISALAPELVKSVNDGAPGTVFVPTTAALDAYLKKAGLTEAKLLAASPEVKFRTTGTLVYHVVPGVGLDGDALADDDWTLQTALVIGQKPLAAGDKIGKDDVVKTLKAGKDKDGKTVVVQGDLSKATVKGQLYAGADVIQKIDNVLEPAVGPAANKAVATSPTTVAAPVTKASQQVVGSMPMMMDDMAMVRSAAPKMSEMPMVRSAAPVTKASQQVVGSMPTMIDDMLMVRSAAPKLSEMPMVRSAAPTSSGARKLLRSATRNNIAANTQRANVRRAMNGSLSVQQATMINNNVAAKTTMGRIPNYFLTNSAQQRGNFFG